MAHATTPRRSAGRMPVAPARKMGNWKMAYADFLTALMAFFLIMWMISGKSPAERSELASYFHDRPVAESVSVAAPVGLSELPDMLKALKTEAILVDAAGSVQISVENDTLRIDLVDSDLTPLFDTGSGRLNQTGRRLASAAGTALAPFSSGLSIEGHTDAFTGANTESSNWDLSSDRANDARRLLVDSGINPTRIRAVTGLADTQPLSAGQPHLSANRRVSILLFAGR